MYHAANTRRGPVVKENLQVKNVVFNFISISFHRNGRFFDDSQLDWFRLALNYISCMLAPFFTSKMRFSLAF